MREKHQLHDKVELLGPVRHSDVRNVIINKFFFLAGIFFFDMCHFFRFYVVVTFLLIVH